MDTHIIMDAASTSGAGFHPSSNMTSTCNKQPRHMSAAPKQLHREREAPRPSKGERPIDPRHALAATHSHQCCNLWESDRAVGRFAPGL